MNPNLKQLTAAKLLAAHRDVVLVVDDPGDQVRQRLLELGQEPALTKPAASASASVLNQNSAIVASYH